MKTVFGYDEQKRIFTKLADEGGLSHAYLLYGEAETGKFLFAQSLAHYLEYGVFAVSDSPLRETFIADFSSIAADENANKESIGIEQVRELQRFLYQTPQSSSYRVAIIRDGEWLTDQAQNALLKILEEPPEHALIIITAVDQSVFMPAISSRLQKVFFPRLPDERVLDFLDTNDIIIDGKASDQSFGTSSQNLQNNEHFGRIGRVRASRTPDAGSVEARELAQKALRAVSPQAKEKLTDDVLVFADVHPRNLSLFLEWLLIALRADPQGRQGAIRAVVETMTNMQTLTLSRRIHIKDILYKIR